jgi:hypothetical protein
MSMIRCIGLLFLAQSLFNAHASPVASAPVFTRLDSLFIIAATGEPRFQAARDSAEAALRDGGEATLLWLVGAASRPDRPLTPRQAHYVERLFTVIADSGRDAASRRTLARAVADAPDDTARARWLYVGSRIGDTAFRAFARPWLRDTSEAVRRMAVRVLGAYPDPAHVPLLWDRLEDARGLERHMRLWALTEHPGIRTMPAARRAGALKRLAPLLADEHLYNRRKVRDMMLKASDSSWAVLRPLMPAQPSAPLRREWRLLARDAKDGRSFLDAERGRMTEEERVFLGEGGGR